MFKRMIALFVHIVMFCSINIAHAESSLDAELGRRDQYVNSLFPYESAAYHQYHPTHIDPISYTGYVAWDGGLIGDLDYTYYGGWYEDERNVRDYLAYLEYWGYTIEKQPYDEPDIDAWCATSTEQRTDRRPLMPTVYVYHIKSEGLLMVARSSLDGYIYDQWLDNPDWQTWKVYDPQKLPLEVQLKEGISVTVEGFLRKEELFILADGELDYAPYSKAVLQGHGILLESTVAGNETLHHLYCNLEEDPDQELMCVKISFDATVSQQVIPYLRAGFVADLADDGCGDCMYVSVLQLAESTDSKGVYTIPDPEDCTALWLVFPYCQREDDEVERLYLCLEDENNPWIGDLRDWQYVNFHIENKALD